MKVLFVHTYYQQSGGEDKVFESEVNAMRAAGFDVETLVFSNSKRVLLKWLLLPFNPFSFFKTRRKAAAFKPDVAHVHNLHFAGSPSVLIALRQMNVPIVATIHNFRLLLPSGHLLFRDEGYLNRLEMRFPWKLVLKGAYKNSVLLTFWLAINTYLHRRTGIWRSVSTFIFLNSYAKDVYMKCYGDLKERCLVKPNFLPDPKCSIERREKYFLYVGRLSEEKGIEILLKAQAKGKFNLTILGDGPLSKLVVSHTAIHSNCTYFGYQPKDVVIEHLKRCAAVILPSTCMEMNPFSVIEAFACGTPIVACDLNTLKPYVVNLYNALLVTPGDPSALARGITDFQHLSDGDVTMMSNNARDTYKNYFSEEQHCEIMARVYSSRLNYSKKVSTAPTL